MKEMKEYLKTLNPQQLEIVKSSKPRIVCMAGAGTGKTHTLISRLKYLVEDKCVDPKSVLVLTFTQAAAKEFESRYHNNTLKVSKSPDFYTFHGFCYNLILNDNILRKKLGYNFDAPTVISDAEQTMIWRQVELECGVKIKKDWKDCNYQPQRSEKFNVELIKKHFNKLLIKRNKITFDKMCFEICELFKTEDDSIKYIQEKYKYIYVDEFQDTDPYQWEFVKSFEKTSELFVVGDIRQSLYRFRNADSEIMKSLVDSDHWETYRLETNYRSSVEICTFANTLLDKFRKYDNLENIHLKGTFSGKGIVDIGQCAFEQLIKSNKLYSGDTAILCRSNKDVQYIETLLSVAHISYRTKVEVPSAVLWMCAFKDEVYCDYLILNCCVEDQLKYLAMKKIATLDIVLYELQLKFPDIVEKINCIKSSKQFEEFKRLYECGNLDLSLLTTSKKDENPPIYVGTIHSVKGLEFDNVYVYGVDGRSFRLNNEDNLNCYYVACTRPKHNLTIVNSL